MMFRGTIGMTLAVLLAIPAGGFAEDAKAKKNAAPAVQADQAGPAELRVELDRAMAALIEARSADKPRRAKVAELTRQVQRLRQRIGAQGPNAAQGTFCPLGGPGAGYGQGRGPGYGAGQGRGPGYGRGQGRGPGYGAGQGRGPGYGRGAGRGASNGMPGRAFVDRDGDGICDNRQ